MHLETRPQLEISSAKPGCSLSCLSLFASHSVVRHSGTDQRSKGAKRHTLSPLSNSQQRQLHADQATQTEGRKDGSLAHSSLACALGVEIPTVRHHGHRGSGRHGLDAAQQRWANELGQLDQVGLPLRINTNARAVVRYTLDTEASAPQDLEAKANRHTPHRGGRDLPCHTQAGG